MTEKHFLWLLLFAKQIGNRWFWHCLIWSSSTLWKLNWLICLLFTDHVLMKHLWTEHSFLLVILTPSLKILFQAQLPSLNCSVQYISAFCPFSYRPDNTGRGDFQILFWKLPEFRNTAVWQSIINPEHTNTKTNKFSFQILDGFFSPILCFYVRMVDLKTMVFLDALASGKHGTHLVITRRFWNMYFLNHMYRLWSFLFPLIVLCLCFTM